MTAKLAVYFKTDTHPELGFLVMPDVAPAIDKTCSLRAKQYIHSVLSKLKDLHSAASKWMFSINGIEGIVEINPDIKSGVNKAEIRIWLIKDYELVS